MRSIRRNLDGYQLQRAIAIRTARLGLLVLAVLQHARDFPLPTSPFVDAPKMRSAVWCEPRCALKLAIRRSWKGGYARRRDAESYSVAVVSSIEDWKSQEAAGSLRHLRSLERNVSTQRDAIPNKMRAIQRFSDDLAADLAWGGYEPVYVTKTDTITLLPTNGPRPPASHAEGSFNPLEA